MQEPNIVHEEIAYGLGCQLEALRLEIRAATRRRIGDNGDANHYEGKADDLAVKAEMALSNPIRSSEARHG